MAHLEGAHGQAAGGQGPAVAGRSGGPEAVVVELAAA
jgi:hypothetical protein